VRPINKGAQGARKKKSTKITQIRIYQPSNYCSIGYCATYHVAVMEPYGKTWEFGKGGMAEMGMGCMGRLYLSSASWSRSGEA